MQAAGVTGLSNILLGRFCEHFFFQDPQGYAIEIQRFRNPEIASLFGGAGDRGSAPPLARRSRAARRGRPAAAAWHAAVLAHPP